MRSSSSPSASFQKMAGLANAGTPVPAPPLITTGARLLGPSKQTSGLPYASISTYFMLPLMKQFERADPNFNFAVSPSDGLDLVSTIFRNPGARIIARHETTWFGKPFLCFPNSATKLEIERNTFTNVDAIDRKHSFEADFFFERNGRVAGQRNHKFGNIRTGWPQDDRALVVTVSKLRQAALSDRKQLPTLIHR